MKQVLWAVYFHLGSTNRKPCYGHCPKGADSWSKFQKARANDEIYGHKEHFHIPTTVIPTLEIGVYEAIACFNMGNIVRCKILANLGIFPGKNCVSALKKT